MSTSFPPELAGYSAILVPYLAPGGVQNYPCGRNCHLGAVIRIFPNLHRRRFPHPQPAANRKGFSGFLSAFRPFYAARTRLAEAVNVVVSITCVVPRGWAGKVFPVGGKSFPAECRPQFGRHRWYLLVDVGEALCYAIRCRRGLLPVLQPQWIGVSDKRTITIKPLPAGAWRSGGAFRRLLRKRLPAKALHEKSASSSLPHRVDASRKYAVRAHRS